MKHALSVTRGDATDAAPATAPAAAKGLWQEGSDFRKMVPQLLVTIINNLLLMDLSMMIAFPTLVIGALYNSEEPDPDGLVLDKEQAGWLGSLVYIFQPLGSCVSGLVTEPLGRRRGMMFVNITPLVGWLMLRFARSVPMLFAANAVLGLGIGFMEAPVLTYVGEISEPRLRSFLTAFTGVLAQTGYLFVYVLGATMTWRAAASVCAAIPIFSFLTMLLVPESPLWLLARGRDEEAERALCWLRGWVRPAVVKEELVQLSAYALYTKQIMEEDGGQSVWSRLRDLLRPETRRPLLLVVAFFLVFHASGMSGVRPYMVHIIDEFALPVDPLWATVVTAALGLLATALLLAVVSRVGKRRLSLCSVAGCALSCVTMGIYAFIVVSGPAAPHPAAPASERPATWLPLAAFILLSFCTYFGVGQIPWMYVAEVYPLRSRGLASGVTAACAYVLYFTAAKTYLQLEGALSLHGVFWLYAACGAAGFAFLYWRLPETEGMTLGEVEELFADKDKKDKGRKDKQTDVESADAPPPAYANAAYAASEDALHTTHM